MQKERDLFLRLGLILSITWAAAPAFAIPQHVHDGPEVFFRIRGLDGAEDIAVDSEGNAYAVGEIAVEYLGDHIPRHFLAKFDPAGFPIWAFDGPGSQTSSFRRASSIVLDASGNPIVATSAYPVAKYDSISANIWLSTVHASILAMDSDGNVIAGQRWNIFKLDGATGDVIWEYRRSSPDPFWDQLGDIRVDAAGDVFVLGNTCSRSCGGGGGRRQHDDFFVWKIDGATGEERWAEFFVEDEPYLGRHALGLDPTGNPIVGDRLRSAKLDRMTGASLVEYAGEVVSVDALGHVYSIYPDGRASATQELRKYDGETTDLLWSWRPATLDSGDRLFVGRLDLSRDGDPLVSANSDLYRLAAETGEEVWRNETRGPNGGNLRFTSVNKILDTESEVTWTAGEYEGGFYVGRVRSDDGHFSPGVCPREPRADCREPLAKRRSSLSIRSASRGVGSQNLTWKWRGEETPESAFGLPTERGGAYELCVYDASADPQPRMIAGLESGRVCPQGKPCWKRNPKKGKFLYASKPHPQRFLRTSVRALQKAKLEPGEDDRAKIMLKGKGGTLNVMPLPLEPPVVAQWHASNGECWSATYSEPRANNELIFKGSSD